MKGEIVLEQKTTLKQIKKEIHKAIKSIVKNKDYKVISNCIYWKIDDYFITAIYFVQFTDNEYRLTLRMNIKLYEYDNIFWRILSLTDNSNQPDSFRANGAFIAPSIQWAEKMFSILDKTNLEQLCNEAINEFIDESRNIISKINKEYGSFDLYILKKSGFMDEVLLKILANIHSKKYIDAKDIARKELDNGNIGRFVIRGIGIYEYALIYLQKENAYM